MTTTTRPRSGRRPSAPSVRRRLRATTADALLVPRRRAGADIGLLALAATLLAATVALALLMPRVLLRSADDAAHGMVAAAGHDADVVVEPGGPVTSDDDPGSADGTDAALGLQDDANAVGDNLTGAVGDLYAPAVSSITSQPATATRTDASGAAHHLSTRLAYVTDGTSTTPPVRWVAGSAPAVVPVHETSGQDVDDDAAVVHEVQVGLSSTAAHHLGIDVGTSLALTLPAHGAATHVVVSGLYTPVDPSAAVWVDHPDLLAATPPAPHATTEGTVGLLLTAGSLEDAERWYMNQSFTESLRFPVAPDTIDAGSTQSLERSFRRVFAQPHVLTQWLVSAPTVRTTLLDVLVAYDARQAAADAQSSVLVLGLAGVGALALVLAARLLVERRRTSLLAERARGASTASVALRAAVESVPLTLGAAGVGALAAWLILPDARGSWTAAAAVAVVAALAPPVTAAALVHRAWSGRRLPANRADRRRLLGRRRARRVTAELTLVVVALAALVSVQRRGLLETRTAHVDPLLAATPLLLAVAATIVLLHVMPPVLRALSRRAQAGRGLVPVVATARAGAASGTAIPLLTLTVAVALLVFCGTTVETVRHGQEHAARSVVGAAVRVDGPATEADVTALRQAPGVTAVAAVALSHARSLGGDSGVTADVEAVDVDAFATILRAHGWNPAPGMTDLDQASDGEIPVLVSPSLAAATSAYQPEVLTRSGEVRLRVVGEVPEGPDVEPIVPGTATTSTTPTVADGLVLVDRTTLDAFDTARAADGTQAADQGEEPAPTTITTVWVDGPGAASAVHAAGLDDRADLHVTTHAGWVDATRTAPLNATLVALLVGTGLALALLAALALALTVVATSGERGRTISALRTLGLDARTARSMTFGELVPLAVATLVAGTLVGIAVPGLLTRSLGLDVATGRPGTVALAVSWLPPALAVVVVGVSLVVAVRVESAARRRDRLGDVLRVGER
ncbi:FtsX-like permease family protein [Luteimicrobium subarcticum]|uniref:Putative ABC transport system permease protein n=1 Tax=Luteimicrobium subarcticum TaxID=620910 RepID=A0A2M8WUR0_9MICO|nr:FtsX-like permease family protein [Luteimicrobium subarcticum]PJI94677.1 putative ABC transport system permease protein [Luteimicrobium subarcticum]